MANMALNIEQRLGQKLTNEQLLLWNRVLQIVGDDVVISPLVYTGALAGSIVNTYSANILYIFYKIDLTSHAKFTTVATTNITVYNEANVVFNSYGNVSAYWDSTAASYALIFNSIFINNVWFSRIVCSANPHVHAIGYQLTY